MSELTAIAELQATIQQKDYALDKMRRTVEEMKEANRELAKDAAATESHKNEIDWLRQLVEKLTKEKEPARHLMEGQFLGVPDRNPVRTRR